MELNDSCGEYGGDEWHSGIYGGCTEDFIMNG